MMSSLRKQVGQLLIVGLEGPEMTSLERSWLKLIAPGGVILFRRNIEAVEQTHSLLAAADGLVQRPLFRCVDVEGGSVDRLRDLVSPMPSLAAVAASGKPRLYKKHGRLIGCEVNALGFNTVFAPVLDLALPESRSVMQTRSYFPHPQNVIAYAKAFLGGLASAGIWGCGKHFPGLGGGTLDSHHATPVIQRNWDTLWKNDLLPYRELASQLPMVMVSHASYPATEDDVPASISRHWIGDVLVKRIRYRGLIVSDDMEMGGILSQASIEEAVIAAVAAGTHLVEICAYPASILRAYEALITEAEKSVVFRRAIEAAYRQIGREKAKLDSRSIKPPSGPQIEKLRSEINAFREEVPEPETVAMP